MERRRFAAWMLGQFAGVGPALGQASSKTRPWRIGFLSGGARPPDGRVPAELRETLRDLGFEEGRNVVFEPRWIAAKNERLSGFMAELLALRVDVIVTQGAPGAMVAKQGTATVPIVVVYAGDVVETGLVRSLARPGGNVTGISDQSSVLSAKRLELLKEAVPSARRVAVLWNASDQAMMLRYETIRRAAGVLSLEIESFGVREPDDFDEALAGMDRAKPDALMMVADALTTLNRQRVVDYAAAHRIPAMYEAGSVVRSGGLMSYGDDIGETYRLAASYVARILGGARPGDLPVQQSTRYWLVLNLKTAKALELAVPPSLRLRADEVIE